MAIKVHHLDCGPLSPRGGGMLMPGGGRMSCHCLLLETGGDGLVLVDTGMSAVDMADPAGRMGQWFKCIANPINEPEQTAARQVARLGHDLADVRHIVMTHLDLDHGGGLADFPHARIHLMQAELEAAQDPQTTMERRRYQPAHWAHPVDWQAYAGGGSETWLGMAGVRRLEGLKDEILLVPLPGHTRGHAGVAVKRRSGWLLHAGDAIMCKQELEGEGGPKLGIYHRLADGDPEQGREARAQLADLGADHGVRIICSHDYEDFQAITA